MKVVNNFVLQGQQTVKDSKIHLDKVYNFPNNSFITDITLTLQPLTDGSPIFQNINPGNTILVQSFASSTSDYTSIVIPQGAYSIDQLCAQINHQLAQYNVTIDIIIKGANFGKAKLTTSGNILFHNAPDIIKVFKFKSTYPQGTFISDGIVDITTGCQTLNVYSSIIKSAPQTVSHSANNLLCSFSIKELTKPNTQHFNNVFIPVHNYNNFVDFILTTVDTNQKVNFNAILNVYINIATIQPQINKYTLEDAIQLDLINTTNITIPVNNPDTTINFNNDIQLPNNSYITRLSLLADAKIHNITSTQILLVDGAQIIFNQGTWDINQLMDKLNTGNAIFNLVISGKDTYKVHITDFQSIDFSNAPQIKNILGIDQDHLDGVQMIKRYPVNDTNNKLVVSDGGSAHTSVVIPNGNYTFDEYLSMLEDKLRLATPLVSLDVTDKYVQFNFQQPIKFVRSESTLNGWFNDINHFFETCDGKTTANGMYYQRICRQGVRYCDGTTKYTFNSTQSKVNLQTSASIRTTINIPSTQQVFSNDYSIAAGEHSFVSIAQGIIDNVNTMYGKTMLSGTASKSLYKVDLLIPGAEIQFSDTNHGFFLDFINLPRIVNASNDSFIMGAFVGNGWFTGSITVPEGTQFTFITKEEEESGVEPHVFTTPTDYTGTIYDILYNVRNTLNTYYNVTNVFLLYRYSVGVSLYQSYAVGKFGRGGNGPQLLDYFTIPESFIATQYINVYTKVNPTITLPEGYYTPEEECSFVKSRIESLPVWGQAINGATWSVLLPRRIQRICSDTCCSLTSINPLWLVNESSGQVFNTGLYSNVNLQFMNPNTDIKMNVNQLDYTGSDGTTWRSGFVSQPTTQEDAIEQMNTMFANKGLAISWKKQETCYSIVADKPFKLGGSFFSNNLLKPIKPGHNNTSAVWTWNYYNDAVYEINGYEDVVSKKVINITNSKEVAKVYCDLVKSYHSCDCLLTNLHIVDLNKNYSSSLELIPIKTSFRTISVKIRDLDDKDYSFAGTIYLNMLISSVKG